MRLGEHPANNDIEVVSTGSLGLDVALGVGGVPRGRVIEVYGPESSGKTTLALSIISQAQKLGGVAAFVDAEHALDPVYAEKLGVDVKELLISQPDTGEQALEITDMLVRSGAVDIVVIDSVAALTPKAEIEGEMGEMQLGLHARLMSQALRKLTGNIKRSNTIVLFINQIRMKIGVMFGNPETTTGGNALKFYASLRLDIRRIGALKNGEEVVGNQTRVKVVKNKVVAAVPRGGVRDPLRQGHFARRRADRHGRAARPGREVRFLVRLRGRAHRPGQGQCAHLSHRASGNRREDRCGASHPAAAGASSGRGRRVRLRKRKPVVREVQDDPQAARLAALKLLNRRDYGARELERAPRRARHRTGDRHRRGRNACRREARG